MRLCKLLSILFIASASASTLFSQITKAPVEYVEFLAIPDSDDWNYKTGEEANIRLTAYAGGLPLNNIDITFEAGNEIMPFDTKGVSKFENGKASIRIGTMNNPGFRSCTIKFSFENKTYTKYVKVGFSPQNIQPTVKMPDDFIVFWKKSISETAKLPIKAETTHVPKLSTDKIDVFLVKLQCYEEGNYIYGYLSKPRKEGRYPALMIPPGAGIKHIKPLTEYAEEGFISLAIEVHGLSPFDDKETASELSASIGEYIYSGLNSPTDYYYKKVYLSCIRAIDYLCSLPEVDNANVGVCGGSQGGALAIVTAALDNRIKYVSAFYPALCDMTGFLLGRAGGWPKIFEANKISQLPVNIEIAANTLAYYDVVNFSKILKVPGFYSYGYCDNTCPPTSVCAAINSIQAPKEVLVTPSSAHWRFHETNQKSIEWMKRQYQ